MRISCRDERFVILFRQLPQVLVIFDLVRTVMILDLVIIVGLAEFIIDFLTIILTLCVIAPKRALASPDG